MMIAALLTRNLLFKCLPLVARCGPAAALCDLPFSTMARPKYVFDGDEHVGFHFMSEDDLKLEAELRQHARDETHRQSEEYAQHWTYPISYVSQQEARRQQILKGQRWAKTNDILTMHAPHWMYPISYVTEEEMKVRKAKEEHASDVRHHAWE